MGDSNPAVGSDPVLRIAVLLAAPLIMGCDIRNIDDSSLETLLNQEVIAIDQDALGVAAWRVVKLDDIGDSLLPNDMTIKLPTPLRSPCKPFTIGWRC
jgi:hypothetical protein